MTTNRPKKDLDCVESKRRAQAGIYEKIKDLSPEQVIENCRKAVEEGPLGRWWEAVQAKSQATRQR